MKMTMAMTLDGLVRALRWKALDLAERSEHGPFSAKRVPMKGRNAALTTSLRGKEDDDDRGRG